MRVDHHYKSHPGSAYDGHFLPPLVEDDLKEGIPVEVVAADRGYDDGENHEFLREKGIASAIHLNSYRTEKKDKNKEIWVKLKESPPYQRGVKERKSIEGKFGEMKKHHGFGRCRYLGLLRYAIQGYLTAIAVNRKRIVKLLTGVWTQDSQEELLIDDLTQGGVCLEGKRGGKKEEKGKNRRNPGVDKKDRRSLGRESSLP